MRRNYRATWLPAITLILALLMSGCMPRATAGDATEAAGEDGLVLDLPTIVIDFDAEGNPSVAGVPLSEITGSPVSILPADTMDTIVSSDIQQVYIDNTVDGVKIFVNGLPVPSLMWGGSTLDDTASTLDALGGELSVLSPLLPIVRQLGVGIVANFPGAGETASLPPMEVENSGAADLESAQDEFLDGVGSAPVISIPVMYNPDGSWTVNGLTDTEYSAIIPGVPWQSLRLPPEALQGLVDAGVSEITVALGQDGLSISLGDTTLPELGWGDGELLNVVALAAQMGLLDSVSLGDVAPEDVASVIGSLIPILQTADVAITAMIPDSVE